MLSGLRQELRLTVRGLIRRPGFTAAAVATLGLGIGASTAIFSVAYGISMRPLPYARPDRLVRVYEANPAGGQLKQDVSIPTFHAWRNGGRSIESAALFGRSYVRFLAGGDESPVSMASVSPGFFDVLGVRPLLGRGFEPESTYTRFTANDVAVISHGLWQRMFGGRTDVIGRSLEFRGAGDNDTYRIVGVVPDLASFAGPVDLWRPSILVELPVAPRMHAWRSNGMIARLGTDATIDSGRGELTVISAALAGEFPGTNRGWTVAVESLHDSEVGRYRRGSWMLLSSVAVVLLVTCLNVGGLLSARAVARRRETAMRAALGASGWRLLRLSLCEASILAALGGAVGLLLAWSTVAALRAAAPPGIPRLEAVQIDAAALVVAALATLFSAFVFAAPPMRLARRDIGGLRVSLGHGGPAPVSRAFLVVAQCAGATTLVVMALLLGRSFQRLMAVDLGWEPAGVLSMNVSPKIPPDMRRSWSPYVEWSDELIARLESTPGIQRAAIATQVPLTPSFPATVAKGRGKASVEPERWTGVAHSVSDGYFQLMGIRLIAGREFGAPDRLRAAQLRGEQPVDRAVALVTEATARLLWPDRPAIGQVVWLPDSDRASWREIVGVVEDIQFHGVGEAPAVHVFVPWTQLPTARPKLLVKADGDAARIAPVVRSAAQQISIGSNFDQIAPLEALVARATAQPRFTSRVVAAFGTLALLLAGVGIYGTLSFMVGTRRREIGIRIALGAPRERVIRAVLWRGLAPAVLGAVVGGGAAVALARVFRALLFNVTALDPVSFAGAIAALLLVAAAAAAGPAALAARTDPAHALRAE